MNMFPHERGPWTVRDIKNGVIPAEVHNFRARHLQGKTGDIRVQASAVDQGARSFSRQQGSDGKSVSIVHAVSGRTNVSIVHFENRG